MSNALQPDDVKPTIATNTDELVSITNDLAKVVEEVCGQIKLLKEERADAVGEVKNAYNLVIANKVWILQQLIGTYWRQTITLELDKPELDVEKVTEDKKPKEFFGPSMEYLTMRYKDCETLVEEVAE
jgi:hypothetical protein